MFFAACGQTSQNGSDAAGDANGAGSIVGGSAGRASESKHGGTAGSIANTGGGSPPSFSGGFAGGPVAGAPAGGTNLDGAGGCDAGGTGAGGQPKDISQVWKSDGCSKPLQLTSGAAATIHTAGTKEPDCAAHLANGQKVCGAWELDREYRVNLPPSYDANTAYQLVFQASGCGSTASNVYNLAPAMPDAIRVGLTPAPNSIGHGTNPGEGCFDDKEGDDSVDLAFYETLYDKLNAELCFDRNRVYASGYSSGSWLANELGCRYAGDSHGRPIRGVLATNGGLPIEKQYSPTCTQAPLAGLWIYNQQPAAGPFMSHVDINRALLVNKCESKTYDTASYVDFPIGGGKADGTCKAVADCPPQFPVVVCALPETRSDNADVAVPAFGKLVKLLAAPR